ncbi:MAG: class I adenylate-forming enzyme family protein [Haloarculaceae archaeon]
MELEDVAGDPLAGNAAALHDQTAEIHGDLPALEMDGETYTHAALRDRSARFAGGLHDLGLEPDDRVVVYLPNSPAYLIASLGGLKAGTPVSFVNPQYKPREMVYQLDDADAQVVVSHVWLQNNVREAIEQADVDPTVVLVGDEAEVPEDYLHLSAVDGEPTHVERDADDVALQPYTSGTTGKPKGVLLTHRNLRAQGVSNLDDHDVAPAEARSLIWLPLYHITGFVHCAWQPLLYGGSLHLRSPARWDAEDAMATVESLEPTLFIGVTAMYVDMVQSEAFGEYDLTSLEVAAEGGAKMSVAVQREFEETAGLDITEGYGLTETTGSTHTELDTTFGAREGTVGQPTRMTDSKIVDADGTEVGEGEEGELLVRGPQVMKGYHDMPEATERAFTERGYFRTGDVARRDRDNYYEIVDRKKHVIVTAGYNVYPSEVEELLTEHEAVAEAAVVPIPDERRNEVPKAFVVPAAGVEPGVDVTAEELQEFAIAELAEYKHPREVEFVDSLPRTSSGKIQKYKLREE